MGKWIKRAVSCAAAVGLAGTCAAAVDWPVGTVAELTAALAGAAANDTVTLAAGTYDLAAAAMDTAQNSHLLVDKPLEIRSADSASWRDCANRTGVVLKGDKTKRLLRVTASGTVVRGVTFMDGASAATGAGVWVNTESGVVTFSNCVFAACVNSGGQGGGLYSPYGSTTVTRECLFDGNTSKNEGGGAFKGTHYFSAFSNNVSTAAGGGGNGNGVLYDCAFSGNRARWGGAVSWGNAFRSRFDGNRAELIGGAMSNSHADHCVFTGNVAEGNGGGALYSDGGANAFKIVSCTFEGNSTPGSGGAILNTHAVKDCVFTGNSAAKGGALYNVVDSTAVRNLQSAAVVGSAFRANSASEAAGAAHTCDMASCRFESNSAPKGGAVMAVTLTDCTLARNSAVNYGGAAFDIKTCRDCRFEENSVTAYDGGAVYQQSAAVAGLVGCTFAGNRISGAYRKGGAVFCTGGGMSMPITNCLFTANAAANTCSAGAVYQAMNVVDCVFSNNTSAYYSGHAWHSAFRNCTFAGQGEVAMSRLVNCTFYDYKACNADFSAPLFAMARESWQQSLPILAVTNCLFRNCACDDLVRVKGDAAVFANCTFASNTCDNVFYLSKGTAEPTLEVSNSIFGGNAAQPEASGTLKIGMGFTPETACLALHHVLAEGYDLPEALLDASSAPAVRAGTVRFCGADNPWRLPPWAVRPSARWVNAGAPWTDEALRVDLAGAPRVYGGVADLGCYEFQASLPGAVIKLR